MGEVFLAEDTRLHRQVALKVLQSAPGEEATRRLVREGRAAARLNHPGIAAVHDIIEDGGHSFIVMEYVEGQTLGALLADGPLTIEKTLDIGVQLAEALAFAHAHGVVHRDVKPGNIIVTPAGRVKLLDLGLARISRPSPTADDGSVNTSEPTLPAGTPAYMAPEQLFGAPADPAADVYATGVVLFELLTGRRPFEGTDFMALALAITSSPAVPSVTALRPDVPERLATMIARSLAKERRDRTASANELAQELVQIQRALSAMPTANGHVTPVTAPRWRRAVPAGVFVAIVIGMAAAAMIDRTPAAQPGPIAVLPVLNVAADPSLESVGSGLVSLLTGNLSATPGLTIVPATATTPYRGASRDVAKAAHELGAAYVVDLDLQPESGGVRLQASLVQRGQPKPLWVGTFAGDLLSVQRGLLAGLTQSLERLRVFQPPLTAAERLRILKLPTDNGDAFLSYSRARFLLDSAKRDTLDEAVAKLESAVAADSSFALAHASLSEAYAAKYDATKAAAWVDRASAAAARALELQPRNAAVHTALARVYITTGRSEDALRHLRRATELAPGGDDAYRLLGRLLAARGELPPARDALDRAIRLRPDYWAHHYELGFALLRAGRYEEASGPFKRVTELRPDYVSGFQALGTARHYAGHVKEAIGYYEHALRLGPSATAHSNLAFAYYSAGRVDDALAMYLKALEMDPMSAPRLRSLGDVYARLGRTRQARDAYERALAASASALKVNPRDARQIALSALCEMKLGRGENGVRHAAEAVALAPKDNEVLFKAAAVQALAGRPRDATEMLRRAVELGYPVALARQDDDLATLAGSLSPVPDGTAKGATR